MRLNNALAAVRLVWLQTARIGAKTAMPPKPDIKTLKHDINTDKSTI